MESIANGIPVHYLQHGAGTPVLALHGVDVDHREIMGALEPVFADRSGYRRIYPDLPGMGRTPAPERIDSTDAVLDTLLGLVDAVIGEEAFLVVGHSYGGYLARAIANRRPGQVAGLALLCTLLGEQGREDERPEHVVLHAADDLDPDATLGPAMAAEFRDYLVVQTPATLRRFQETVVPGMALADKAALERIFQRWELRTAPEQAPAYANPTLILAGRQDATVGYVGSWRLLGHYPRATFAVLDRAGHALPHEHGVELSGMLLKPNMVISGKDAPEQSGVEEVATATVECLLRTVPAAVPGIVFLSGGQSDLQATAHLNAMNSLYGGLPWELSFSYARALQGQPMKIWSGDASKVQAAQKAFHHRAKMNSAARSGDYSEEMEEQAA